ncbi:MAG: hypothetical protein IKI72_08655 [Bacteroidales bacterium]|nr:hypothetical protein [Bacteroidales bacterium]
MIYFRCHGAKCAPAFQRWDAGRRSILLRAAVMAVCWLALTPLYAQFYPSDAEPASTRWEYISTPQADLIFRQGRDREAQYMARTLMRIDTAVRKSLLQPLRRIPIVMHSQSMTSNGFVVWTPRRMELYTTPSPTQYAQNWLGNLAVHEYRHVAQISRLHDALPRTLKWMFGEQPTGLCSAFVPYWYLEGDAVVTETALTDAGRGRTAGFSQLYRAQLLDGRRFTYEKSYLGSYKDAISSYYVLGYHLVSHLREETDNDIFGRQLYELGRKPYRMGLAWKQTTGKRIRTWYEEATDSLLHVWQRQDLAVRPTRFTPFTQPQKTYTEYTAPQVLPDLSVVAVKRARDQVGLIVQIQPDGSEKVLARPGEMTHDHIHYSAGKVIWNETVSDLRWRNISTSRLRLYDLETHQTRTVVRGTQLVSPVLSPDAGQVAAVSMDEGYRAVLTVLQTASGAEIFRAVHPSAFQLQSPAWSKDGRSIYVIALYENRKRIEQYLPDTGTWRPLTGMSTEDFQHLRDGGDCLLFDSPRSGITNIYALDYSDGTVQSLTSARFGAMQADRIDTTHLVYADFSADGYAIVSARWRPQPALAAGGPAIYAAAVQAEHFNMADNRPVADTADFPVRRYRKAAHLLNVHSWAPFYVDYRDATTDLSGGIGVSAVSQDLLGQMIAYGGYEHENSRNIVRAGFNYYGLYPVIEASVGYGKQLRVYETVFFKAAEPPTDAAWDFNLRTYTPLVFSRNAMTTTLTPLVQFKYNDGYYYNFEDHEFQRGAWEFAYSLRFSSVRRTTDAELSPRLGYALSGQFTHSPTEKDHFSRIGYARMQVFLPGLGRTHRVILEGGFQRQHVKKFVYSTGLDFPRGYDDNMASLRMSEFRLDYLMPLLHPDLSLGRPLYLKRVYADLFFDYARNTTMKYRYDIWGLMLVHVPETLRSYGADLYFDCNFFRFYTPATVGLRLAYLPDPGQWKTDVLMKIAF